MKNLQVTTTLTNGGGEAVIRPKRKLEKVFQVKNLFPTKSNYPSYYRRVLLLLFILMFIHRPMLSAVEADNRLFDLVILLKGRDRECLNFATPYDVLLIASVALHG